VNDGVAIAAFLQLAVFAIGALVAYRQLCGLRNQQEGELIQRIFEKLSAEKFADALEFVYSALADRLKDPTYVSELRQGRATAASHPELHVLHFFNALGLLVHAGMVREELIVPFVATPCMRSWQRLTPVIELMRRRYPHAYSPFESLVVRSRGIDLSTVRRRFRRSTPRLRMLWEGTAKDLENAQIADCNTDKYYAD
jgi:hypothetical protein